MKSGLILLSGNLSSLRSIHELPLPVDVIVAADGGADLARKLNIVPHAIVGDLDSISRESKSYFEQDKNILWHQYPREKDLTDAQIAFEYIKEQKCTDVYIIGLMGDRLDHLTANLFYFAKQHERVYIIEGNQLITWTRSTLSLSGTPGDELSLIPFCSDCTGISTTGLQYPLTNETLPLGSTRGVSNVFINDTATISLTSGTLMVIKRNK